MLELRLLVLLISETVSWSVLPTGRVSLTPGGKQSAPPNVSVSGAAACAARRVLAVPAAFQTDCVAGWVMFTA